jgi:hypothetical protein
MSQLAAIGGWVVSFAHLRRSPLKGKIEMRMPPLPLTHPHDGSSNFVITRSVSVLIFQTLQALHATTLKAVTVQ